MSAMRCLSMCKILMFAFKMLMRVLRKVLLCHVSTYKLTVFFVAAILTVAVVTAFRIITYQRWQCDLPALCCVEINFPLSHHHQPHHCHTATPPPFWFCVASIDLGVQWCVHASDPLPVTRDLCMCLYGIRHVKVNKEAMSEGPNSKQHPNCPYKAFIIWQYGNLFIFLGLQWRGEELAFGCCVARTFNSPATIYCYS